VSERINTSIRERILAAVNSSQFDSALFTAAKYMLFRLKMEFFVFDFFDLNIYIFIALFLGA
jgi:hypothetical protein